MKRSVEPLFVKIAHRGASAYEPENTIRSFERAIELKADMIEFDVRKSLDGQLVVIHDSKVNRTTDGGGLVGRMSLAELKELDAGKGERIPTIEEALECAAGRAKFVIELKEKGLEEDVIKIIKDYLLMEDVVVVSFSAVRLKAIKEIEPRLKTGIILFASTDPLRTAKYCGADVVAPFRWFITKRLVARARQSGLYLFTWTVDDGEKAAKLRDIGVNGIVTNKPDLM